MKDVVEACRRLRMCLVESEYQIHDELAREFERAGIEYSREAKLAPRSRIDFLCIGNIGVEVKKGKPNSKKLAAQARRYLDSGVLDGLILLVERNVYQHDREYLGKPIEYISLSKLWGVAL